MRTVVVVERVVEQVIVIPTLTATDTPTATLAPTDTPPPSPTRFITDTPTSTFTPTFTFTPTATDTATHTPLPSLTPTPTDTPTATFTPTIDLTRLFELELTRQALFTPTPTPEPTWTPVPPASPTASLAPTLNATPTFIVATLQLDEFGIVTPATSTPNPFPDAPTATFTPTNTPLPPPTVFNTPLPPLFGANFSVAVLQTLRFNAPPNTFFYSGANRLIGGEVVLFAGNPRFPESYARTDSTGMLYFSPPGGGEIPMNFSPFFEGFVADNAETNKNRVVDIAWSPNGQYLAFVVFPSPNADTINAGVWFWQPAIENSNDPTYAVMRDCPAEGYTSCFLADGHTVQHWRTQHIAWSPDSRYILANVLITSEGGRGVSFARAVRDPNYANRAAPLVRYDSGVWLPDGRVLLSGNRPDGLVGISVHNLIEEGGQPLLVNEQLLYNASENGMWLWSAAQRGDGRIVAFGREGGRGGPERLYLVENGVATPISEFIGGDTPQRIEWTSGGNIAVVTVGGAQYLVDARSGSVRFVPPSP